MTEFAANFTAIDFETANHRRDSACQLAAVRIRDGKIADSSMWMIRPEPFFFTRGNIRIHGITPSDVQDEPSFGDLWPEISETLGEDCLVAHNANFDIGVLLACLKKHRQDIPKLNFTCTRVIARRTWPNRRRYGLKPLADWLGIRFQHHDALEDSIACAKILLAAGVDKEADSVPALEKRLRISRGTAGDWGHRGPSRQRRQRANAASSKQQPQQRQLPLPMGSLTIVHETHATYQPTDVAPAQDSVDLQRLLIRADFVRPLAGKSVVFAGKLKAITSENARLLASRSGGKWQSSVTRETSLLVMGQTEVVQEQQQKAEELRSVGHAIQILSEEDFLGLVGAQTPRDTD